MNKKKFVPTLYPISRELSKEWFIRYKDKAGRILKMRGKLNQLTTTEGRLLEADRLILLITSPERIEKERKTGLLGQMSDLLEYKRPFMRKKGYESYSSILNCFARWYTAEASQKKEVIAGDYIRHLHEQGLHKNTIRGKNLVLKGLVQQLIRDGKQTINPFTLRLRKVKAQSKLPFSDKQIDVLKPFIQSHDAQLWDACEFMYYLYLRPNEIRQLKVEDIIYDSWKLYLNGTIAKDADTIYKAIPIQLRPHLSKYISYPMGYYIFGNEGVPGRNMTSRDNLSKRMKSILTKLNFGSRYSFYSWIHTGIKKAAMSGIPIKQLQIQKGHHDLNMFNQYLKDLGVEDCVQLIENFPSI